MKAVVVVFDSLPVGYVGCYGNEWIETPALDEFAATGFLFDFCFPNQPRAGIWREAGLSGRSGFSGKRPATTLLDDLNSLGVATIHVGRNRSPGGFGTILGEPEDTLELLLAKAAGWIEEHPDEDWLLWIDAPTDVASLGMNEEAASRYLDEEAEPIVDFPNGLVGEEVDPESLDRLRMSYGARVSALDEAFGRFLETTELDPDQTLWLLTADQGYPLGEHELVGNGKPWLFEERIHTPLLMRVPGGEQARRSPSLVQASDLRATLSDHFGVEPSEPLAESTSLLPLVRGEPIPIRDFLCLGLEETRYAIRTHQWQLVLSLGHDLEPEEERRRLHAKPEDRWDVNDLTAESPDVADLLELQLYRYFDAVRRGTLDVLPPIGTLLASPAETA
ncbi:Sulfatase [Planctomycetes bacterium Pan216]|uniref:Sulfatase n=1 Tax=Kolteria novifilia TaxID=2527975 RepID=A0A518B1V1_9BACT|nr:Sulfatase [Planctomycetes bacterium Pan216]